MRKITEEQASARDMRFKMLRLTIYLGDRVTTMYKCPKCLQSFGTRPHDVWQGKVTQCNSCRLHSDNIKVRLTEEVDVQIAVVSY